MLRVFHNIINIFMLPDYGSGPSFEVWWLSLLELNHMEVTGLRVCSSTRLGVGRGDIGRLSLVTTTSSPKGNDRSPESNVPRSNLIKKNRTHPSFNACSCYMKVSKGSNQNQQRKSGNTIFPIISLWGYFLDAQGELCSRWSDLAEIRTHS